jgi:hypothetical protein
MTNKRSSAAKQRYADQKAAQAASAEAANLESAPKSGRFIATVVIECIGNMIGEVEERLEFDECWNDAGAEAMRDDDAECEGYQDDADVEEAVTDSPVAGSDAAEVVSFIVNLSLVSI